MATTSLERLWALAVQQHRQVEQNTQSEVLYWDLGDTLRKLKRLRPSAFRIECMRHRIAPNILRTATMIRAVYDKRKDCRNQPMAGQPVAEGLTLRQIWALTKPQPKRRQ